jgi:hypothetical protein
MVRELKAAPRLWHAPLVASEGDCIPRNANGGKGACINNQPCRGFGVRAENGSLMCTCYGRKWRVRSGTALRCSETGLCPRKRAPFRARAGRLNQGNSGFCSMAALLGVGARGSKDFPSL